MKNILFPNIASTFDILYLLVFLVVILISCRQSVTPQRQTPNQDDDDRLHRIVTSKGVQLIGIINHAGQTEYVLLPVVDRMPNLRSFIAGFGIVSYNLADLTDVLSELPQGTIVYLGRKDNFVVSGETFYHITDSELDHLNEDLRSMGKNIKISR
jgi:hypothetical protein